MRALACLLPALALGLNNGLGATPAMGYSSWNDCSSFRDNGPNGWCWNSEGEGYETPLRNAGALPAHSPSAPRRGFALSTRLAVNRHHAHLIPLSLSLCPAPGCGFALSAFLSVPPPHPPTSHSPEHIRNVTSYMISSGLASLGYLHVNVDEGWLKGRNAQGALYEDLDKFPSGMKALGDWIKAQVVPGTGAHMRYGLYSCRGTCQCGTGTS